jgi:hypothetical protein
MDFCHLPNVPRAVADELRKRVCWICISTYKLRTGCSTCPWPGKWKFPRHEEHEEETSIVAISCRFEVTSSGVKSQRIFKKDIEQKKIREETSFYCWKSEVAKKIIKVN